MFKYFSKELGYEVIIAEKGEKIYNPDAPVYWPECLRGLRFLKKNGNPGYMIHAMKRDICRTATIEVIPHYHVSLEEKPCPKIKESKKSFWDSHQETSKESMDLLKRLAKNKRYQGLK